MLHTEAQKCTHYMALTLLNANNPTMQCSVSQVLSSSYTKWLSVKIRPLRLMLYFHGWSKGVLRCHHCSHFIRVTVTLQVSRDRWAETGELHSDATHQHSLSFSSDVFSLFVTNWDTFIHIEGQCCVKQAVNNHSGLFEP